MMLPSITKRALFGALCFTTLLSAFACGDKAPPAAPPILDFPLTFVAKDTEGDGIAKVPVLIDGSPVGFTDREGMFKAVISDIPGKEIMLALGSIKGYEHSGGAVVKDKLTASRTPEGIKTFPIKVESEMLSTEVETLIWVSAKCAPGLDQKACRDLEVQVNGDVVASTDPSGRAHFTYTSPPGETLSVKINTPTYSSDQEGGFNYFPPKPEYKIEVGSSSEVHVIDETFSDATPAAQKPKPRRKTSRRRIKRRRTKRRRPRRRKPRPSQGISIF